MFIVVTSLLATGVSGKIQRLRKPDGKIIPVANSVDHARYPQDSRISNLRKLADDIQRQAARELEQMSVSNHSYLSTIEILQWRFNLIAYLLSSSSQVSSSTSSCDDEDYEVRCIAVRLSGNQRSSPTCIKAIEDLAEALDDLNDKDMEEFTAFAKAETKPESEKSWTIKVADIDDTTFDLSTKNPNTPEEAPLRKPDVILAEMETLDTETNTILKSIKELI